MTHTFNLGAGISSGTTESSDVSSAFEALASFVDYFDGTGPIEQRAQNATQMLSLARNVLRNRVEVSRKIG